MAGIVFTTFRINFTDTMELALQQLQVQKGEQLSKSDEWVSVACFENSIGLEHETSCSSTQGINVNPTTIKLNKTAIIFKKKFIYLYSAKLSII